MLKKDEIHSSSGNSPIIFLIIVFAIVALALIVKNAQKSQDPGSHAATGYSCGACTIGDAPICQKYSGTNSNTGFKCNCVTGGATQSCPYGANVWQCNTNDTSMCPTSGGTNPTSTPPTGGGGGTSSVCSNYSPTASACRNVTVNNLCKGYNSGYYCKKSGTTNSNDNMPNCGCVQGNGTPAPTPTNTPAPGCTLNGQVFNAGQCGCNVSGYDTKMCAGGNTWITRTNICGNQCHPLSTPPPVGTSCDSLPGGAEPLCVGKKVGDACSSASGPKCKIFTTSQGGTQTYYCDCSL